MAKKKNDTQNFSGLTGSPTLQNELVNSSPRAAAILAAAALEVYLERLLDAFFVDDSNEIGKFLKGFEAPLGTFSARIRACYCLGLVSKDISDDLHKIKEIRNTFAHHIEGCTFEEPYIVNICNNFTLVNNMHPRQRPEEARVRFNVVVYTIETFLKRNLSSVTRRLVPANIVFGNPFKD